MILNQSFIEVSNLNKNDWYAIAATVRPFQDNLTVLQAKNISQYTFLNGYSYAELGVKGLTNEFLNMLNDNRYIIKKESSFETNSLNIFLQSGSEASKMFIKGMNFYNQNN